MYWALETLGAKHFIWAKYIHLVYQVNVQRVILGLL